MISPLSASESHCDGNKNLAAVCSIPPSEVGMGMNVSESGTWDSALLCFEDEAVTEEVVWPMDGRK